MFQKIRKNYTHTIYACYLGLVTQAIVNNFAPLLFLTFVADYELTLSKITLITTINFLVQISVDFICAKYIDKWGHRRSIVAAHVFSALGLCGLALFPKVIGDAYGGILLSVVLYAIGGGILEVLVSPIVEACPTTQKEAAMSLLHSFYCWGHVAVVLLSTLFFYTVGIENWKILACLWAILPLVNAVYFMFVPIYPLVEEHEKLPVKELFGQKLFWLFIVLMICSGASEQAMSQWASAFAESALQVSKTVGDLLGPCAFAVCMGSARALYGKYSEYIPLKKMMAGSAMLCIACYIGAAATKSPMVGLLACAICGFSVGIFWPGTFSMSALAIPGGGTAMYAFMALAGDVGCATGPTVVGMVANAFQGNLKMGLIMALAFPLILLLGLMGVKERK